MFKNLYCQTNSSKAELIIQIVVDLFSVIK